MQVSLASGALWGLTVLVSTASSLALPVLPPGKETYPFTPFYRLALSGWDSAQAFPPFVCSRFEPGFPKLPRDMPATVRTPLS